MSAIGSLMSSPSTRTVYKPVIDPRSARPLRSSSRGSRPNTLGGYPCVAGGSPAASPTSRCAMAKRVTESIMSTTSSPRSRNHSAIRVAVNAALIRTMAGASEVATTTTERAMPSGPRSRSMNSATSRPRSPISATTETFASVPRAIIDRSDDLPTPDPAKMPNLWPLPHGIRPSRARTPRGSCSSTSPLRNGCGGCPSTLTSIPRRGGPPSIGRPRPSSTRPRSRSPTTIEERPADGCGGRARTQPGGLPECHAHRLAVLERDDLGLQGPIVGEEQKTVTDRGRHAADLNGHPDHLIHPPVGSRLAAARAGSHSSSRKVVTGGRPRVARG